MAARVLPLAAGTLSLLIVALTGGTAGAQAPKPPEALPAPAEAKAPGADAFAALAWLEGCWRGSVTDREFNEHWLPPRGNLMVGASHTVVGQRTQGYEYLRIEVRSDGVFYVAVPSGQKETSFRLVEQTADTTAGRNDQIFRFANPANDFPKQITYRRASEGWLYATVEGMVGTTPRQVIYPMRRIDCELGEPIRK